MLSLSLVSALVSLSLVTALVSRFVLYEYHWSFYERSHAKREIIDRIDDKCTIDKQSITLKKDNEN